MQTLNNFQLKSLGDLTERRSRQERRQFLLEGKKLVEEAVRTGSSVKQLLFTEDFNKDQPEFIKKINLPEEMSFLISSRQAAKLSEVATPPGIFAVVEMPDSNLNTLSQGTFLAALDGIADPGNLGTIIRTSDWFGLDGLLLSPDCVDPYNAKVVRSAMGSLLHLPVVISQDFVADLRTLREAGFALRVTDVHGKASQPQPFAKSCLVMGSESHGVRPEVKNLADEICTLPRWGKAESLNVAVSFGILLHSLR